jgi:hypothetical protein
MVVYSFVFSYCMVLLEVPLVVKARCCWFPVSFAFTLCNLLNLLKPDSKYLCTLRRSTHAFYTTHFAMQMMPDRGADRTSFVLGPINQPRSDIICIARWVV